MTASRDVVVLWSIRDCAQAIADLQVPGPLPSRMVLVPRGRVAHSLRRQLLLAGLGPILAGTRFVPVAAAAAEVLGAAGTPFTPGEEALRGVRLLALFRAGLPLRHFSLDLLRSKPGWDEAFAHAIGDLEAADLDPDDLERQTPAMPDARERLGDVATIWRALDAAAGASWTYRRSSR